jgi:hypothetical protein
MTFTATPEPGNTPPRVLLEIDSDEVGSTFTSLTVTRNGDPILQQPQLGAQSASVYDYLAPFGQSVEYIADGEYLGFVAPDWTENWASLASWTGSGWSLGAGDTVESTTANATITRSASGTIQRVNVTDPDFVRVEVVTAGDVLVASVAVTTNIVLTGTSSAATAGSGSFELNLTDGTVTATGDTWSVSRPYTGVPTKVRLVSLGGSFTETSSFSTTGNADRIAVAPGGNIYALDITAKLVRKFNSAGVFQLSWSTTGTPSGIAVDSGEAIYVTDRTSDLVRKYTSAGAAGITWSTTGDPLNIGIDATNAVYVLDDTNTIIRKYTNTGTVGITFGGWTDAVDMAVAPDGTVYIVADPDDDEVEKYTSTGAAGTPAFFPAEYAAASKSSATNAAFYLGLGGTVEQYTSAGVAAASFSISPNTGGATATTSSGALLVGDTTGKTIHVFTPTTGSVGTIVTTGLAATTHYREIISTTLNVDEAWLLHPSSPSLSVSIDANTWRDDGLNVAIESAQSSVARSAQTLHYPIGRPRAVVIGHGNRLDDEWTLVLTAPRLEDRDAVSAIVRDQTPLLIRSPLSFGWDLPDGFYAIGDVTSDRYFAPLLFTERRISLPLTPSDPPVVRQGSERTYGDLLLEAASYSDLLAMYDTYTDLLTGSS